MARSRTWPRPADVDDVEGHSNGGCAADYDNDGDKDLFLTNYGTSKLFSNDGDGTFTDVTEQAKVGDDDRSLRSSGCAWGDYDRDGFLDLMVVRHLKELDPDTLVSGDFYLAVGIVALYHADGDGSFTDVTPMLGDTGPRKKNLYGEAIGSLWGAGFQPGWLDYDSDGDPGPLRRERLGAERAAQRAVAQRRAVRRRRLDIHRRVEGVQRRRPHLRHEHDRGATTTTTATSTSS